MPLPSALRALRSRNYRLFFVGQLISLSARGCSRWPQSWLVYRLTGSAAAAGPGRLRRARFPVFLLAPLGGILADRGTGTGSSSRRRPPSMLLAFTLAALTLSGRVQVWHIFVLAALLGVVNAFDIPARQAFLVEMVGRDDLDERHRAELLDVQRRPHRRAGDRRDPGGGDRRGLVLLR